MRQAHVLGQIVVGAEPQTGNDVEIRIARGKKDDRQRWRKRPQLAAQRKTAVDVVGKPDVDDGEIGKPCTKRVQCIYPGRVGRDFVALLAQDVGVIGADHGFVFDDGDTAAHWECDSC